MLFSINPIQFSDIKINNFIEKCEYIRLGRGEQNHIKECFLNRWFWVQLIRGQKIPVKLNDLQEFLFIFLIIYLFLQLIVISKYIQR